MSLKPPSLWIEQRGHQHRVFWRNTDAGLPARSYLPFYGRDVAQHTPDRPAASDVGSSGVPGAAVGGGATSWARSRCRSRSSPISVTPAPIAVGSTSGPIGHQRVSALQLRLQEPAPADLLPEAEEHQFAIQNTPTGSAANS